ncbi:hypothetical protein NL676_031474 [Syzygium grande]|nr:hypothetical protein NL676_031474 [Syzygium grande]
MATSNAGHPPKSSPPVHELLQRPASPGDRSRPPPGYRHKSPSRTPDDLTAQATASSSSLSDSLHSTLVSLSM